MKRLSVFLFSTVLLLVFAACDDIPDVTSIRVNTVSVDSSYEIGELNYEDITLEILHSDDSIETVQLVESMIDVSSIGLENQVGTHSIVVNYEEFTTTFDVTIINSSNIDIYIVEKLYQMAIDDEDIDSDLSYQDYVKTIKGTDGYLGQDYKDVLFREYEGYIQWKNDGDEEWNNLVRLIHLIHPVKTAYEVYKEYVPEYTGTEIKWEKDIVDGTIKLFDNYTITYNTNEGTAIDSKQHQYLSQAIVHDTTTRSGYRFIGWYVDENLTEAYSIYNVITEDLTLYAKWEKLPVVLNWNIGSDPFTLDPGLNGSSDGGDVINNMFEGLVRERDGVVYPGMADSWTVSEDGLTVTFHIRDDAKWSDGTRLTADDFVRSWLRGMDPRNESPYNWIWEYTNIVGVYEFTSGWGLSDIALDDLKNNIGIESQDDGATLVIHLTTPTNWLVSLLSYYHFMPVPESATIDNFGAWAKNPELAISNGPFTLTEYSMYDRLVLERNEHYWNKDNVEIEKINGYMIDYSTQSYAMYMDGGLDITDNVPVSEIPFLQEESDEFHSFALLGTYYVMFNLSGCDIGGTRDNTVFCNENLRKALALSLDRTYISDVMGLGFIPATGYLSEGFTDHNGEDFFLNAQDYSELVADDSAYELAISYFEDAAVELYPLAVDTESAVTLLQQELNAKTYYYNTSSGHEQIAQMIQMMWSHNLGFTIQLADEHWSLFLERRNDGNFDISRGGWLTDYMDPTGMLEIHTQENSYNAADYNNPLFDAKISESQSALEIEHFTALYEAYEIFMDDMPVIPIYHYNDYFLVKNNVQGWSRSVLGPIDFSVATVIVEE